MEVINLCDASSLVSQYMSELRDVEIQRDRLRFRKNVHRLGQIMAYEISKRLDYEQRDVTTPLGIAKQDVLADRVVLATVLRAGLPFHEGFLDYYDGAENGFVSAYRKYANGSDTFDIHIEYIACPRIDGKTLILVDPMLATGSSMDLALKALLTKGKPAHVHVAAVISTDQALDYMRRYAPTDVDVTLWTCDLDHELNAHSYIVPGLGDAGDLLYGVKE